MLRNLSCVLVAGLLAACSSGAISSHPAPSATQRRIVSLVPSFTEDLFAIGAGPRVVGVSAFTDAPKAATKLPQVADFSSIDTEKIVALRPDIVVGIPSQDRLVEPLRRAGIAVVTIRDDSYGDLFTVIRTLGALTGERTGAASLSARLLRETSQLRAQTKGFRKHPSVFVALGSGPIWTVGPGSYIGTLVEFAGGRNAAADLRAPYGEYSAEALLRAQPDVIVAGHDTDLASVSEREPWRDLRAVREHHVYAVAVPDLLYRPGPRYNEGLHWLIERLTPLAK